MLLLVVKGAQSYEWLCTYNGVTHPTFKEACSARVFLVMTGNGTMHLMRLLSGLLQISSDNSLLQCFYSARLVASISSLKKFGGC
jgi:hypothetical protein